MLVTFGLIIDIVLIGLLLVFGFLGMKKGFLKSVLSLFSWLVCIIIAAFAAKYVAGWINGIYDFSSLIGGAIEGGLVGANESFFSASAGTFGSSQAIIDALSTNAEGINGLLAQIIKVVFSNVEVTSETSATIAQIVGVNLGNIIMIVITGILLFLLLKLAVFLLSKLFDNIARTKVLGGLNRILGFAFGALKAALVVVILNCVLVGLSLIPAVNSAITPVIQDNTHIEKFVYNKTDEIIGKYIIEENVIQTWVENLWESR